MILKEVVVHWQSHLRDICLEGLRRTRRNLRIVGITN